MVLMKKKEIKFNSTDFWTNLIDFVQNYWALIEENGSEVKVYFIHECSVVFSEMSFETKETAEKALRQNGFKSYYDPLEDFSKYMRPPEGPYYLEN